MAKSKSASKDNPTSVALAVTRNDQGKVLIVKRRKPAPLSYFRCELKNDEPTEVVQDEEIAQVKWVKPEELQNYFTSNLDPNVAKYLGLA